MIDGVGKGIPLRLPNVGGEPAARVAPAAVAPGKTVAAGGAQVVRELSAQPPVDTAKVEALRSAIAAGTYKVDPDAIAARMIALEQGSGKP